MKDVKYGCGIDIAKDKFDACLGIISLEQGFQKVSTGQFTNSISGFKQYCSWIQKHCKQQPLSLVHLMEATGIYYENLAMYLDVEQQQFVSVVVPSKAKKYKQSLGFKSKTDGIDALALSRMCCEQTLIQWKAPSAKMYSMRMITPQIESITTQITSVKNQLEAFTHSMFKNKQINKLLARQVIFLDKQKEELLLSLDQMVESDPVLKVKFANITVIKGLGTLSVATIVAETNGFELFENLAQVVSYSGYDVVENQSGKHVGKTKISKKGNGRIRRSLHFPALNVVRYNVYPFVQLYDRVHDKSNIKMKGYTAVQKKLLVIIYTLWKKDEPFNNNYHQNNISKETEKEPSLVSASKKQQSKKVASAKTEATQDKHPSKHRSMPSLV